MTNRQTFYQVFKYKYGDHVDKFFRYLEDYSELQLTRPSDDNYIKFRVDPTDVIYAIYYCSYDEYGYGSLKFYWKIFGNEDQAIKNMEKRKLNPITRRIRFFFNEMQWYLNERTIEISIEKIIISNIN